MNPFEGTSEFDYSNIRKWLHTKGIETYGPKFHLYEDDIEVILSLLSYFLRDGITAPQRDLDLRKGILLSGPVGCGKTSLMSLMRHFSTPESRFFMKPCRDISFEFIEDGFSVIQKYSRRTHYQDLAKSYCFDDLGVEGSLKYFGNECNVMAEILLNRYDLFVSQGIITHVTTNLSASEIEAIYGNRVRSRFRELFNLIAFPNHSKDKRK